MRWSHDMIWTRQWLLVGPHCQSVPLPLVVLGQGFALSPYFWRLPWVLVFGKYSAAFFVLLLVQDLCHWDTFLLILNHYYRLCSKRKNVLVLWTAYFYQTMAGSVLEENNDLAVVSTLALKRDVAMADCSQWFTHAHPTGMFKCTQVQIWNFKGTALFCKREHMAAAMIYDVSGPCMTSE